MEKVTIPALARMKRDGQKIAGIVAWDTPMARLADRAGANANTLSLEGRPETAQAGGVVIYLCTKNCLDMVG